MDDMNGAGTIAPPDDARATAPECPHYTVRGFLDAAGSAIRRALSGEIWLEAQVSSAQPKGWGWILELVDAQAESAATAPRLKCVLYKRDLDVISGELGFVFDPKLLVGTAALLKVRATFDPQYQLGSRLIALNPALTRGLLLRQAELLKVTLQAQGIFDAQHRLRAPGDVTGVAVIAPEGSAGLSDVEQELRRWHERGILAVTWLTASFEGPKAATSLGSALSQARSLAASGQIDAVLIVRGGGSRAGVAAASSEEAVRGVLGLPVPVIVGLGHASDTSLLDEVAWHSAHTPSKALGVLQKLFTRPALAAMRDWKAILTGAQQALRYRIQPELQRQRGTLLGAARGLVGAEQAGLEGLKAVIEFRRAGFIVEVRQLRQELDACAVALSWHSAGLPIEVRGEVDGLYGGLLKDARTRLDILSDVEGRARETGGCLAALLARQGEQLQTMLRQVEDSAQRILLSASLDLSTTYSAVQAHDVDVLLNRGLVLAVRTNGKLVRSAAEAAAEPELNLRFGDGEVAVVPRKSLPATRH